MTLEEESNDIGRVSFAGREMTDEDVDVYINLPYEEQLKHKADFYAGLKLAPGSQFVRGHFPRGANPAISPSSYWLIRSAYTSDMGKWYEQCVEYLLHRSGQDVQPEPTIHGQTPDLLVIRNGEPNVLLECFVAKRKHTGAINGHFCGGDIRGLHRAIYNRLVSGKKAKATKYRDLVNCMGAGYIIAVYDDECINGPDKAVDLCFSAHVEYLELSSTGEDIGYGWEDVWSTSEMDEGLFNRYTHVSGLLYSRYPSENYYLPNPWASVPVSTDLFPFACIPEAPSSNGSPVWQARPPIINDDYMLPPNTWWRQVQRLVHTLQFAISRGATIGEKIAKLPN